MTVCLWSGHSSSRPSQRACPGKIPAAENSPLDQSFLCSEFHREDFFFFSPLMKDICLREMEQCVQVRQQALGGSHLVPRFPSWSVKILPLQPTDR